MSFSWKKDNLQEKWDLIPKDTDILITHMPPHGILDVASSGSNWGCKKLLVHSRDVIKPKVHLFGHVHEGFGMKHVEHTTYVNAAMKPWPIPDGMGDDAVRTPIVFDYTYEP